jgi:hypothetical protein
VAVVGQIVCMQALFYVSLGCVLVVFAAAAAGGGGGETATAMTPRSLGLAHLLSPRAASRDGAPGFWWAPVAALVLNAVPCAVGLAFVVGRARKCLDFAATAHLLHVAVAACYAGLPLCCAAWWLAVLGGAALMAVLGEFLCMKRELREIPISHRDVPALQL